MRLKHRGRAGKYLLGVALAVACQSAFPQALDEIVVTARRQGEEKLMETPLAITAFDADAIESQAITSLGDVANLTPGLSFFNPLGENLPTPIIRGVVPQDIWGENAAAIFVDGVYVAGRQGLNFSQLDIERIEVMKGPQSATYGRNAFSGAINYVTKPPSDVFEAKVEGDVGNRGKQKISAQISGPVWGEALTGRVAVLYDEWDGSYNNTLAPWSNIGGYRYRSYQGKLRWRPIDTLDINFSAYRSNDRMDEFAAGGVIANCEPKVKQTVDDELASTPESQRLLNWCGRIPRLKDLPQALDPRTFDTALYPQPQPLAGSIKKNGMPKVPEAWGEKRDLTRLSLSVDWETEYGTLTSLTGYSYMKEMLVTDFNRVTGYGMPLVYCTPSTNTDPPFCNTGSTWARAPIGVLDIEPGPDVEEWSQEIRFTSRRDQRLRWQAGGYYFHAVENDRKGDPALVGGLPAGFNIGPDGHHGIPPIALPTDLAIGNYIFGPSMPSYPGLTPAFESYAGLDPLGRPYLKANSKSWSLFGGVDYDLTDKLKARAELRYTNDHRWSNAINHTPCLPTAVGAGYPAAETLPIADCGDAFYDLRVLDAVGYDMWVKDAEWCADNPGYDPVTNPDLCEGQYKLNHIPGYEGGSARFDYLTWRTGLDYIMDSGWMIYGSVAYSKKPGGVNILPSVELVDHAGSMRLGTVINRFDPEKMTAYELGIKGYTPDRRVSFDMAVFFSDWKNVVLRQLTETDPATGMNFRQPQGLNVNSGDAHVFGWELTTNVAITDNLSSRLTVGYTDSKMKKGLLDSYALFPSFYTNDPACDPAQIQTIPDPTPSASLENKNEAQAAVAAACQAKSGDISGKSQMRQPPWTASLSFDYQRQLFGDWDFLGNISGNFVDKQFIGNDNLGWVPPRAVVNMSLGLESPRYSLKFWVRNLFNDDKPLSGYRDIFWTNDSDMYASVPTGQGDVTGISNFDDFPPMRLTVTYPTLRTWGLTARMRFGGAEKY